MILPRFTEGISYGQLAGLQKEILILMNSITNYYGVRFFGMRFRKKNVVRKINYSRA